jgi:hypothetical protein
MTRDQRIRWWVPLLAIVLAWFLAAVPFCRAEAQMQLEFDVRVRMYLEQIADTATVEHARCVLATWHGDTLRFDGVAEAPWIESDASADAVAVNWGRCPGATRAIWHNHLYLDAQRTRDEHCYASRLDEEKMLQPTFPPLLFVSVGRGVSCAFMLVGPDRELRRLPWHPIELERQSVRPCDRMHACEPSLTNDLPRWRTSTSGSGLPDRQVPNVTSPECSQLVASQRLRVVRCV